MFVSAFKMRERKKQKEKYFRTLKDTLVLWFCMMGRRGRDKREERVVGRVQLEE